MRPWVRKYNYISDWYSTVYELYTREYPAYPVNYYSIDWEYSRDKIDMKLVSASYELNGVGDLSGLRWNKIRTLPVYNIEQIQPSHTADERGVVLDDSLNTAISIPSVYNIKPYEGDFIHFSQSFMMNGIDNRPLFIVKNVELSTFGELTIYRLVLKAVATTIEAIDKQVTNQLMFLEYTKSICEVNKASILLKLESKSEKVTNELRDILSPTGFFIYTRDV